MQSKIDSFFTMKFDAEREKRIAAIISTGEQCEVDIQHEFNGVSFVGPETELRILFLSTIKLTISRVMFKNQRKGTLSKILDELIVFCKENDIEKIVAECVHTKEMAAFCIKHRFTPDPNASIQYADYVDGNYVLQI